MEGDVIQDISHSKYQNSHISKRLPWNFLIVNIKWVDSYANDRGVMLNAHDFKKIDKNKHTFALVS